MEAACHWPDTGEYSRTSLRTRKEEEDLPPVTDRGCSNQELAGVVHFMMDCEGTRVGEQKYGFVSINFFSNNKYFLWYNFHLPS